MTYRERGPRWRPPQPSHHSRTWDDYDDWMSTIAAAQRWLRTVHPPAFYDDGRLKIPQHERAKLAVVIRLLTAALRQAERQALRRPEAGWCKLPRLSQTTPPPPWGSLPGEDERNSGLEERRHLTAAQHPEPPARRDDEHRREVA